MKSPIIGSLDTRSRRNLLTGFSYQVISISMGLLLPYLFITNLGSESNGLLNSVGQVFTCLGLLEAGVGTATVQALYRPIAQNDKQGINGILSATHHYYQKTGVWYAISVSILTIVYPFFVDSELSSTTIRLVIFLQGIGAVVSYLFQAKYSFLLKAEGKNYILTSLSLITLLLRNTGKIVAIQLGYNIVAVQAIHLATVLVEAVIILSYVKKKYPWLNVKNRPNLQSIAQKNSVMAQSVAWMIFNHTDILVLTIFTRDLKLISVYSVYSLVFEAAQNLLNQTRDSFQFKIGRVVQDAADEFDNFFTGYGIKILFFTFAVFTSIYLISAPFVALYTKGVTDTQYGINSVPELFFAFKLLYGIRALYKQIIEANGHFRQTQFIAIGEAFINIVVSVGMVTWLGITGVLIGTVVSLVFSATMYIRYAYKNATQKAVKKHIQYILISMPIVVLSAVAGYNHLIQTESWINLISIGVIACVVFFALYGLCYMAVQKEQRIL